MPVTDAEVPIWVKRAVPKATDWERRGLHRYRGRSTTELTGDSYIYVVADADEKRCLCRLVDAVTVERANLDVDERTFERLERRMAYELLGECVVPDCGEKAPVQFTAAGRGRLAGRDWMPGDTIDLCPAHGNDVHRAHGAYGMEQLAEWLRADATLDPMDAFDAEMDSVSGREIARDRARMMRLALR